MPASTDPIVTRTPASGYLAEIATVSVMLSDGQYRRIECFGPYLRYGAMTEATVNWPGVGAMSAADTLTFAEAMRVAAELAPTLAAAPNES